MTMALCFSCGATKFGAICPCPECEVGSSGDMNLDIAFSDHRLSLGTLKGFGEVIRSIRQVCDDDHLRFSSFLYYVSINHAEVLGVRLPPEEEERCALVLARASPPMVKVEESEFAKRMRRFEAKHGPLPLADETAGPPDD